MNKPAPGGATPHHLARVLKRLPSPSSDVTIGVAPVARQYGVVVAVNPSGAPYPTVSVTLGGGTTQIAGVRYLASYSPNVSDTVLVDHVGTDIIVVGRLA